ncbi:MAG: tetratricopeptide repeat protein [Saprospiraceae bacterium]|nr:tetratricopeptide repeat protein [Saprospiraceae bacterium]
MNFKVIISGRLTFKNERSIQKAMEVYAHKCEVLYKYFLLFKTEDIFDEASLSLSIPRFVKEGVELKLWNNTMHLLQEMADFAMAGSIGGWRINNGELLEHLMLEPSSDKGPIHAFLEGKKVIAADGNLEEAAKHFTKAIQKFDRHDTAYERRAYVHFLTNNHEQAITDYTQSIAINDRNAEAYFGRAIVYITQGNHKMAIEDLINAIQYSIALQALHWRARRLKGRCHLQLGEYEKASTEFNFFTSRRFKEDDPNIQSLKDAYFDFGKALLKVGKASKALEVINKAARLKDGVGTYSSEEWKKYHQIASNAVEKGQTLSA